MDSDRWLLRRRMATQPTQGGRPPLGAVGVAAAQVRADDGLHSPETLGGSPLLLTLSVPDFNAAGRDMVALGGVVVIPIEDRPYGKREGRVHDLIGNLWVVSQDLDAA